MKSFLILILSITLLQANSISKKIASKEENLKSSEKLEVKINRKLEDIADSMKKEEEIIQKTSEQIQSLKNQIQELEAKVKDIHTELDALQKKNIVLKKDQKEMEEKIIKIIADEFAFDLIKDKSYQESIESIMVSEILEKMSLVLRNDFEKLILAYNKTGELIQQHKEKISNINSTLKSYETKKAKLQGLQEKHKYTVKKLEQSKQSYIVRLNDIQEQQKELKKTLEELKIIEKNTEEKEFKNANLNLSKEDVRRVGSSYQKSKIKKYKGEKTIAPLDDFVVKRKFGNYIDPVYKIKIFNESVVLSSNQQNAKVKNVLNGKVIFAKETPILDKVIIVENQNGIHTIYAHLNQIAPTIKVGRKIKKGYVIGRIKNDLTFEVTQKNYHIDPMELIKH